MDLIENLLNPNVPLLRIRVPTGQVNGRMMVNDEDSDECEEFLQMQNEIQNTDYAEIYQKREEELYTEATVPQEEPQSGGMSQIDPTEDLLSSVGRAEVDCIKQEELREVYTKYNFDKQRTEGLVIDEHRDEILNLVQTNQVVIIQGPTGCGKTTQVPQFILDDCKANDKPCKIIVTQPRRIAAISVARRVCEERSWAVGGVCGYQVGLERNLPNDTLLAYVTSGVLLQKLIKQKNLHEYTHIVVDEVHERNQDMDFLLLILRRFLNTNSPTTRVILMSATFDTDEFANYFKNFHHAQMIPAPVIYVAKHGTKFNIQTFYAEQLKLIGTIPPFDFSEPKIDPSLYKLFVVLIRAFDKLDPIDPLTNKRTSIGNVLVFLPGILEIEEAHDRLLAYSSANNGIAMGSSSNDVKWHILPLHSSITIEEQRRVFQPPPPGQRKIILSTNIAESSITVPDISFVVDFCLTKMMTLDSDTQYQSLQLQWASHINCIQRAGRVGRVSDGRVYRLVTRNFFEYNMLRNVQPEILRAPLNHLVLSAKLLELNEPPKAILALAMNPPNLGNIDNTVLYLKEIGALSVTCNGRKTITDGDLTFLGRVVASLPLDVHLSKFILLGYMFSCLDDCIIMATGCSLNAFKSPFKERLKAYSNRLQWADGSASDLLAYLNLYKVWQRQRRIHRDPKIELDWCKKNYVSQRSLREWNILVKEIKDRLANINIRQPEGPGQVVLSQMETPTVIKVVICGAFYPNYFKRSSEGGQTDEREAVKTLGGRDPYNTVYFTGFDPNQPGPLYAKSIKKLLADCATHMQVSFDSSNKVYVQFTNTNPIESVRVDGQEFITTMPGKIKVEVYRAIKLRQLRIPNRISVMNKQNAWELAKKMGIDKHCVGSTQLPVLRSVLEDKSENDSVIPELCIVPTMDIQFVSIYVTERIDAGHFWAHNTSEHPIEILYSMNKILNNKTELQRVQPGNIVLGNVYASKYPQDNLFYRCKALSLNPVGKKQSVVVQIIFIDYGNTAIVREDELYELPKAREMMLPPLAMECFLSEIQPSVVLNPRALWVEEANAAFDQQTQGKVLFGKVYSVVNGIVHLELHKNDQRNSKYDFKDSLNAWLIKKEYAQPAEESFLSKQNHMKRLELIENPEKLESFEKEEESLTGTIQDVEPPSAAACTTTIDLKGPYSPLEMQIYSAISSGCSKQISIDSSSVNAVLLDTDPQDPHERLIVAAHIGQNASGSCLSLRHTTVMPNIYGFPMLMSLLFCPTMEPKPTEDGTQIGAILCGLGSHEGTHRSLYPPHDICLSLDCELNEETINKINEIRYWMNMAIETMESGFQEIVSGVDILTCQRQLKERLFGLLKIQRKPIERVYIKHSNVWGKSLYNNPILQPGDGASMMRTIIWPLHWLISLNKGLEERSAVEKHLNDLEEVALRMQSMNEITCQLCNQTFYSAGEVRIHLASKQHIDTKNNLLTNSPKLNFPVNLK